MGIPYPLRIKQLANHVAAKGPLADPKRLGSIPYDLKPYQKILPTLLHGKRITFGDKISEKGSNRTRRAYHPNVLYRPFFSRVLGMNVWARVSSTAIREIDAKGGFDEYLMTMSDKNLECDVAKMYKRKILEGYYGKTNAQSSAAVEPSGKGKELRSEMEQLLGEQYGEEYIKQLKDCERQFDKLYVKRR
ncbi:hypothetical protein HDU85_002770 [Gaertneriomyces sp. JEL0708]|nr:hypothetical protein BC832DRAFT_8506 [Gaertneriomyces semiglobifer]KAJ3189145.1 hypothetical protein HDU85_002770 [Gaertneriomyces sp. JEL0708]